MKRLPGQAAKTIGYFLHHTGMTMMTIFFVMAFAMGGLAYRLSLGPIQIPILTSQLASMASGHGIAVHIKQAALAWGGFKKGADAPLFLQLGEVSVRNEAGTELVTIPSARLVFVPSALLGGDAPVMVTSTDALFEGSNLPVSLQAAIHLGFLHFSAAHLTFSLGAGDLGAGDVKFPITSGHFTADLTPQSASVQGGAVALAPVGGPGPVIGFSGQANLQQNWQAQVRLTIDRVQASQLPHYWPAGLTPQTRDWVVHNITVGNAHDGEFTLGLSAPETLSDVSLVSATGHFGGDDLSIGWVPKAQLITGVTGEFTLNDMNTIKITASTGQLGGVVLTGGQMVITGVSERVQVAHLSVPVVGTLTDTLAVLNAPPLNLLRTAPEIIMKATGAVSGTVTANFPLLNNLLLAQVDLHADTHLTGVMLPVGWQDLALRQGDLALQATIQGLQATGTAQLDGEVANLTATANFATKLPDIHFGLQSIAGARLLGRLGITPGGVDKPGMAGAVPIGLTLHETPDGTGNAVLNADLTRADLGIPEFGWHKQAGDAGAFSMTAAIAQDGSFDVRKVSAHAPDLAIDADADSAGRIAVKALQIGTSAATGTIMMPQGGAPWQIDLGGPTLDVSNIIDPEKPPSDGSAKPVAAAPHRPEPPRGPTWQASLHFDQLILAKHGAPVLQNLQFSGNGQGSTPFEATASAAGANQETIKFSLSQAGAPPAIETWHLTSNDAGFLLRALNAYDNIQGGALQLDASYADASDMAGQLTIDHYRLLHAPILGKILQSLSIYGVADAASGPGLVFDRLNAPFSFSGNVLTLKDARAYSSSLGLTASGTISLPDEVASLDTTVIPAYALNSAPGKIPLIGKLFSAEAGGGLFAITAKITGNLANPSVQVNPLSALTPGLMRGIFGMSDGASSKPPPGP